MKRSLLSAAAALLLAQGIARAETFDLYVFRYCPTGDPVCGVSEAAYQNRVLAAVQEINIEWEVAGISFRPTIFPTAVDNFYSLGQGCDGDVSDTIKAIRQLWREQVAALYPNAISVMVTQGASWCCSPMPNSPYVPNPPDPGDAFPNLLGIYCTADWFGYKIGTVWSHELGHYFCLRHTQTFQDPADNTPVNHDNDPCCGVDDTPPDPSRKEGYKAQGGGDLDADDNPVNGHEWCEVTPTEGVTDDGSPHATLCDPTCYLYDNDQQTVSGFAPYAFAAMSYFKEGCRAPYVVNGQKTEAFTPDSVTQIRDVCRVQVPDRANLPDVCLGHGGDTDHDGICQDVDNCPSDKNTNQQDQDLDGLPDGCDLCPKDPNPTGDLDGDNIGDLCDPDMDGDNCPNEQDQHPAQGQVLVGYKFNQSCGFGTEPVYESEEKDADGDGVESCFDVDDDNDGVCDDAGPVDPTDPGHPPGGPCEPGPDPCLYQPGLGCYAFLNSPNDCQPDWLICLGGGCVEFLLKLVSVINPAEEVAFDTFRILDRRISVPALPGHTASETAKLFQGEVGSLGGAGTTAGAAPATGLAAADGPAPAVPGDPVRLEIWSRRTNQRVAIVGEYRGGEVVPGDVTRGGWLELIPTVDPSGSPRLDIRSIYGADSPEPEVPPTDSDADGRPDIADNCTLVPNFVQADADGDFYGDLCDADVDNDLLVTGADVDVVRGCEGVNLRLDIPLSEPATLDGGQDEQPPDPVMIQLAIRCMAMDLDGDGDVDPGDTAIATAALGTPPGPSAKTAPDGPCGRTTCDDGLPCTTDYCDPLTGQCTHAPGACDDHNVCTVDSCNPASGQCEHAPLDCNDSNPCTRDSCDQAAGGCRFTPDFDGTECDDNDPCTLSDACGAGRCAGSPLNCPTDEDPCYVEYCDPATGQCVSPGLPLCDDGNPCTTDLCSSGGTCTHPVQPDETPCSDGSACTQGDVCRSGACAGSPLDCNDSDACTTDACDPPTGLCLNTLLDCDDGNPCTIDQCSAAAGACAHSPIPLTDGHNLQFLDAYRFQWDASRAGKQWNSYRGTIPTSLMGSRASPYDHLCLESADLVGDGPTMTTDLGAPGPGTAFYYEVSEETDCGEGPPGYDGSGVAHPNPMPCPTPP